jgi:hypothetical protein
MSMNFLRKSRLRSVDRQNICHNCHSLPIDHNSGEYLIDRDIARAYHLTGTPARGTSHSRLDTEPPNSPSFRSSPWSAPGIRFSPGKTSDGQAAFCPGNHQIVATFRLSGVWTDREGTISRHIAPGCPGARHGTGRANGNPRPSSRRGARRSAPPAGTRGRFLQLTIE